MSSRRCHDFSDSGPVFIGHGPLQLACTEWYGNQCINYLTYVIPKDLQRLKTFDLHTEMDFQFSLTVRMTVG